MQGWGWAAEATGGSEAVSLIDELVSTTGVLYLTNLVA